MPYICTICATTYEFDWQVNLCQTGPAVAFKVGDVVDLLQGRKLRGNVLAFGGKHAVVMVYLHASGKKVRVDTVSCQKTSLVVGEASVPYVDFRLLIHELNQTR